jgi:type 1 glutamine amidotransferase
MNSPCVSAADSPTRIKALIITGDDVDVHHWKETTAALKKILTESGRFDVTISEDLKPLESADELKAYDVIVFNRFNRKAKLSDEGKKNLLDFVRGGKGFYVEHLASASFADWPEFGKLCGRHWVMGKGKSGHGPRGPFDAKIADDKHPITAGLKDFRADDELYAKLQGTEPINVLVEADSDWSKKTEPLVFWLPYGEGRVVHCTLGHDPRAIAIPETTTLIVRGIEWAATGKVAK